MDYKLPDGQYIAVTKESQLEQLARRWMSCTELAIDTETTGLDWKKDKIVGVCITHREGIGYYIPVELGVQSNSKQNIFDVGEPEFLTIDIIRKHLAPLFASNIKKYMHNAKFDMHFLREEGMEILSGVRDTMLLAWVIFNKDGERYSLKHLVKERLNIKMIEFKEALGTNINFSYVDLANAVKYAAPDADMTMRIGHYLESMLPQELEAIYNLESEVLYVLYDMEKTGIKLSLGMSKHLFEDAIEHRTNLLKQIKDITSIDTSSPKQLSEYLFKTLKLPTGKMKEGKAGYFSTGKPVLNILKSQHPVVSLILEHRKWDKLINTYYVKLPDYVDGNSRIHASFSSIRGSETDDKGGITSGRLSSSDPNLQQIPPSAREAFIAEEDSFLVCVDYSQQEVRILALQGNDTNLIKAFNSGSIDVHAYTASILNGVTYEEIITAYKTEAHPRHKELTKARKNAKTVTFGVAYGKTPHGFAADMGCTFQEAEKFIEEYYAKFPGVKTHIDSTKKSVIEKGYAETIFGRRRYFDIPTDEYKRDKVLREAVNMPIQGGGADIVKMAMVACFKYLRDNGFASKIVLQVHDEIVFEVKKDEMAVVVPKLKEIMETIVDLPVPMVCDVEYGSDWLNIKEYK